MLKFRAEERITYRIETWFKLSQMKKNKVIGLKNGFTVRMFLPQKKRVD